jgi:hypothetical protein
MISLEKDAAARLESQGYIVFRFVDSDFPGNLFASRDDQGLFITLMRVHRPHTSSEEVAEYYAKTIRTLRKFPPPKEYHFEIWVFAFATRSWQYYRIDQDRVVEVDHAG